MSITNSQVETSRLNIHLRQAGEVGEPLVVLVHGNVSSGVFFEETMTALAGSYHVLAPDLRGYGDTERKPIDATRGVRDFSDDLADLVDSMGLTRPLHLVGWSIGAGVAMQYAVDHPENVASLVLESAMSPYGFGGTRGEAGEPVWDDYAGSGGGTANPDFTRLLAAGERGAEEPVAPLNIMRGFYVKAGFELEPDVEQRYLDGMLATGVGDDMYPGDLISSPNWPGVAPGTTGVNNAISPKYLDLSAFAKIEPVPPVLWVRGDSDQIVSDTSFFDFGFLGQEGLVPDWPGDDVYPPQPMVGQLRAVLEEGGNYTEVVYEDCGHSPHIEKSERFVDDLNSFWDQL